MKRRDAKARAANEKNVCESCAASSWGCTTRCTRTTPSAVAAARTAGATRCRWRRRASRSRCETRASNGPAPRSTHLTATQRLMIFSFLRKEEKKEDDVALFVGRKIYRTKARPLSSLLLGPLFCVFLLLLQIEREFAQRLLGDDAASDLSAAVCDESAIREQPQRGVLSQKTREMERYGRVLKKRAKKGAESKKEPPRCGAQASRARL